MVVAKLDEQYASAAFELITREFVEHHVIEKALGTRLEDYQDRLFAAFQNMLEEGLSLVVFDPVTKNLIRVLLATDLMKSTMVEARKPLSVQSPLSALCADLELRYLQLHPKNAGKTL